MITNLEKIKVIKLIDSLYGDEIQEADNEAIYCEIQYKRDKSSFAGMAFKLTNKNNNIIVRECEEKIVRVVNKFEKLYMGCNRNYINSIKEIFVRKKKAYGIEILFLIYSDERSSQIIFEELMTAINDLLEQWEATIHL